MGPFDNAGNSNVCLGLSLPAAFGKALLLPKPHCIGLPDVALTSGLVPDL